MVKKPKAKSKGNGETKDKDKPIVVHIGAFKLKNSPNRRAVFIDLNKAIGFPVRVIYLQKDTKTNNRFFISAVLSPEEGKQFTFLQSQLKKKNVKVPTKEELEQYGGK